MSPRPYRLQQRLAGIDATRAKIIAAARRVLISGEKFSLDAVARDAGVARLTIYDRFGSREVLLEAVFDDLAESGGLTRLPQAFRQPDPKVALEQFVVIFCGFYSMHRVVLRRLNALAVLQPESTVPTDRNSRRLQGLSVLLARVAEAGNPLAGTPLVLHTVHALTGFAFIDEFAGHDRDLIDVARDVVGLVEKVAHLE